MAGLAKGTLYLYYDSKRELYRAALRAGLVELCEAIERAVAAAPLARRAARGLRGHEGRLLRRAPRLLPHLPGRVRQRRCAGAMRSAASATCRCARAGLLEEAIREGTEGQLRGSRRRGGVRGGRPDARRDPAPADGLEPRAEGREGGRIRRGVREEGDRAADEPARPGAAARCSRCGRCRPRPRPVAPRGRCTAACRRRAEPEACRAHARRRRSSAGSSTTSGSILGQEQGARGARASTARRAPTSCRTCARAPTPCARSSAWPPSASPGFGDFPELIGPFNVVDARGYVSQTVFDLHALRHAQSEGLNAKAAAEQQRSTRDAVVLACAGLYLQAVAGESRIEAAKAQLATAQALFDIGLGPQAGGPRAGHRRAARAGVLRSQRQRLIVAENEAGQAKAGAWPARSACRSARRSGWRTRCPSPRCRPITRGEALANGVRDARRPAGRRVARSARRRQRAARRQGRGAAVPRRERATTAAIGNTASERARARTAWRRSVRVPMFEGGQGAGQGAAGGRAAAPGRGARSRTCEGRVYYEVQAALLDLAADRAAGAAWPTSALTLAEQQLQQAQRPLRGGRRRQHRRRPGAGGAGPRHRETASRASTSTDVRQGRAGAGAGRARRRATREFLRTVMAGAMTRDGAVIGQGGRSVGPHGSLLAVLLLVLRLA